MKKDLVKAILAGIVISIGAVIYLSLENKVIGALLFAVGLLSICCLGLNLFTGKIGYVIENKQYGTVALIWCGNFIGTFLSSTIIKFTRIYVKIIPSLENVMTPRITDNYFSLFVLAIYCGLLMYTAVEIFRTKDSVYGMVAILLCVSVFILSGYEHSIANMAYFTLYGWNLDLFVKLIVITIGNSFGGMLIPFCKKMMD